MDNKQLVELMMETLKTAEEVYKKLQAELEMLRKMVKSPENYNKLSWCKYCIGPEVRIDFTTIERNHTTDCPWLKWKETYEKNDSR